MNLARLTKTFSTLALAALCGCVTVADLDQIQNSQPLRPEFALATGLGEDAKIEALAGEKLLGKWETTYSISEGLWISSGTRKTFPTTIRMVWEFLADGTCTCITYENGKYKSTGKSKWTYSISRDNLNLKSVGILSTPDFNLKLRSVFWYGDDKMALTYCGKDSALEWKKKIILERYDKSWWWTIGWRRDENLNCTTTSSHISPDNTIGHRRVSIEQAQVYRRLSGPPPPTALKASQTQPEKAKDDTEKPTASYEIASCEREAGSDFAYKFELQLKGEKSLKSFRAVQREFREAIKEDYSESFAGTDAASIYVEFPEYRQTGDRIEGRAVVLTISAVSLKYDPKTRTGILAVRIGANQFEEARAYIRKNIETLARDKNIALVTGEIPPAAKFYLGREEIKDGNILEIEFKTE